MATLNPNPLLLIIDSIIEILYIEYSKGESRIVSDYKIIINIGLSCIW